MIFNHCLSDGYTDPNSNGEVSENDHKDYDSVEVSGSDDDEKCNSEDDETIEETIVNKRDNIAKSRWNKDKDDDYQKVYAEEILTLGMMYSEYSDAIKEGDGIRVMRCWKFLMLILVKLQRGEITPVKHSTC
ncbi:MAG: hypothetical protein MJE68_31075 [Proteobacteria bacterium]|nr:hypothetical protein [Pseudomonadota bacterium]